MSESESKSESAPPIDKVTLRSYPKTIFFYPLFFTAFDFGSTKFFILILAIVIIVLLVIFLVLPRIEISNLITPTEFNIEMTSNFYMVTTFILGTILLFIIIVARFDYWKIEQNELYHVKGIFTQDERYPVANLRIKKEIPDVFEYFILKAGSMTIDTGKGEEFHLRTVVNVEDKIDKLNRLLSRTQVEIDELD